MGHVWAKNSNTDPTVKAISEEMFKDFSLATTRKFDSLTVISSRYGYFNKSPL